MSTQSFSTIPSTNEILNTDKILIGKTSADYSTTVQSLDEYLNPGFRLLIYYGVPQGVNGYWNDDRAAMALSYYDYIVFGAGLELDSATYHTSTQQIFTTIKKIKAGVKLFGYIDAGVTSNNFNLTTIQTRISAWQNMGATDIFLDNMGYDYHTDRARQNSILDYIHSLGMKAMINAWNPDDAFASTVDATYNASGTATTAKAGDYYLSESFIYNTTAYTSNKGYATQYDFKTKEDKVISYVKSLGILPCAIDIYDSSATITMNKLNRICNYVSALFGKKAFGLQISNFSASDNIYTTRSFISNDFYRDMYTPNVYYTVDNDWINYSRYQSGKLIEMSLQNAKGITISIHSDYELDDGTNGLGSISNVVS